MYLGKYFVSMMVFFALISGMPLFSNTPTSPTRGEDVAIVVRFNGGGYYRPYYNYGYRPYYRNYNYTPYWNYYQPYNHYYWYRY